MFRILAIACLAIFATSYEFRKGRAPRVEPDYLDQLRKEGRWEEFSYYIGANDPDEVIPRTDNAEDEWIGKGLCTSIFTGGNREEARQAAKFSKNPEKRWPKVYNRTYATVPYVIGHGFNSMDAQDVLLGLQKHWNDNVPWIKWTNYIGEQDYVYIFQGTNCGASLGRRGGQQGLELAPECLNNKSIAHEAMHTIGLGHEHSRYDRDNYIKVLEENIYPKYRFAYEKQNPDDFDLIGEYDYYTFMHYWKTAFTYDQNHSFIVLKEGIDINDVGQATTFTKLDIAKMKVMYDV